MGPELAMLFVTKLLQYNS